MDELTLLTHVSSTTLLAGEIGVLDEVFEERIAATTHVT